jgi:hypothetical protein
VYIYPSNNKLDSKGAKIMKKSLSIIAALVLVFTVFSSVAFADTAPAVTPIVTADQQNDMLTTLGVFTGDETGDMNLDGFTNRAQTAKIIDILWGLPQDPAAAAKYKDLNGYGWATGYIGATSKIALFRGDEKGNFNPGDRITIEQLATVFVRAFQLPTSASDEVTGNVSTWAKSSVAAALKAGLIPTVFDYTASATRADLILSAYASYAKINQIEPPGDGSYIVM